MYDVIVIGGGPAGMSAALYLLRNNKKVLIIEKNAFGGQIATSPRLENYPTVKSISGLEWADKFFEQITDLGAEFELEEVKSVVKEDNHFQVVTNYHKYEALTVIIANGVQARQLGLEKENELRGHGVSYCAVCDGPFYKGEETFVIGDGNTAMQNAIQLANYSPKVHILTLFDHFCGDEVLAERIKNNPRIEVVHNLSIRELIGEETLTGIKMINTKTNEEIIYKTNNVFVAIGQIPHNECFEGQLEMVRGFIVVNANMETSVPGIFAAGDTTDKKYRQVITACNDGSIAAISAISYISMLED